MESRKEVDVDFEAVSCDIPRVVKMADVAIEPVPCEVPKSVQDGDIKVIEPVAYRFSKLVKHADIEIEPVACEFSKPVQDDDIKVIEPVGCSFTKLVKHADIEIAPVDCEFAKPVQDDDIEEVIEPMSCGFTKLVRYGDTQIESVVCELSKVVISAEEKEENNYIVDKENSDVNKGVDEAEKIQINTIDDIEQEQLECNEEEKFVVSTFRYTQDNIEAKSTEFNADSTKKEIVECTTDNATEEETVDFVENNNNEGDHLACTKYNTEEHDSVCAEYGSEEEIENDVKENISEKHIEVESVSNEKRIKAISRHDEGFKGDEDSKSLQNSKKKIPCFKKYDSYQKSKCMPSCNEKDTQLKETKCIMGSQSEKILKEDSLQIPPDVLVEKINRNAEFYFTDFNILKNNFLLKHIKRNKEGYVSLKLVASFRKVKYLTKDFRVVAYSLERSKILELNANKTKVRRIIPIPKVQDTKLGKTVIVFNLAFQKPTSEKLTELFSKFGNIISAEIMTSKSPNFNIYHKRCRFYNKELTSSPFGCIEFDKYEDAMSSIKDEESHLPKENKMKVVPLVAQVNLSRPRIPKISFSQGLKRGNGHFRPERSHFENPSQECVYGRPLKNDGGYKRFYQHAYPSKIAPVPNAFYSQSHPSGAFYANKREEIKRGPFPPNRQLKTSNSMNVSKPGVVHPQTKGPDRFTRNSD